MNSTELRSGNLILWNGSPYRVTALDIAKLETYPDENVKAEGIVLTEAWLVKYRFEKGNGLHLKVGEFRFSYYDDSNEWEVTFIPDNGDWIYFPMPDIKHLHVLQNFIYSYTGQELTIKQD